MSTTARSLLAAAALFASAAAGALALSDAPAPVPAAPAPAASMSPGDILSSRSAALVTVRFNLKMEGRDNSDQTELTGVMIDAKGLVLISNAESGGLFARFYGMKATPMDMKVLVGDDTVGVDAKIIARDSELDLAWVQIDKPADKPYTFIDFAQNAKPKVGDTIYVVSRLGRFFDRSPVIEEARILGEVSKPRPLFIGGGAPLGLPIYDAQGRPVGVSTLILPENEEMQEMGQEFQRDLARGLILPAAEVVDATARARESAAAGKPVDEPVVEPAPEPAPAGDAPKP